MTELNELDNQLLKELQCTGNIEDPEGIYASLYYRLYDRIQPILKMAFES